MKDTKHIRRDLHSVAWVRLWGAGGSQVVTNLFFFKHGHVAYQIDEDDEQNRINRTNKTFTLGLNW